MPFGTMSTFTVPRKRAAPSAELVAARPARITREERRRLMAGSHEEEARSHEPLDKPYRRDEEYVIIELQELITS
jgi:hypothetical protein